MQLPGDASFPSLSKSITKFELKLVDKGSSNWKVTPIDKSKALEHKGTLSQTLPARRGDGQPAARHTIPPSRDGQH